ncbi:MAG: sulfite exporter TauE/SafE family protein [Desulfobacteraceae bacterium]|nr:sulfite exporter TauE/SafE family protein [Desulfobacteraceae bacterium]
MNSWISLPAGVIIGSLVSTIGIGGGILWMPLLLIILDVKLENAIVTSLLIQTAGMGSGTLAFWVKKRIDAKLLLILLPITIPGIALGAYLTRITGSVHLELFLGVLTLSAAFIFVSTNKDYAEAQIIRVGVKNARKSVWIVSAMAISSGMLSVSIGEWLVPYMRNKFSLHMNVAVATSIATIFGTCIFGSLFHLGMGRQAEWKILCWAVPGVIIGGQIGPRIAERINDRILKEIFIFLLTLIGIHLIYNSY